MSVWRGSRRSVAAFTSSSFGKGKVGDAGHAITLVPEGVPTLSVEVVVVRNPVGGRTTAKFGRRAQIFL